MPKRHFQESAPTNYARLGSCLRVLRVRFSLQFKGGFVQGRDRSFSSVYENSTNYFYSCGKVRHRQGYFFVSHPVHQLIISMLKKSMTKQQNIFFVSLIIHRAIYQNIYKIFSLAFTFRGRYLSLTFGKSLLAHVCSCFRINNIFPKLKIKDFF